MFDKLGFRRYVKKEPKAAQVVTPAVERMGFSQWPYNVLVMAGDSPYRHEQVWIWRREWPEPRVTIVSQMGHAMNVDGLMWRPLDKAGAIEEGQVNIDGALTE